MRVLFDTNLLISYMLRPDDRENTIVRLVELVIGGRFELILPMDQGRELSPATDSKRYLRSRITPQMVTNLVRQLQSIAFEAPSPPGSIPRIVRDPKDDYLLAAAAIGDVDILVTGDRDLLSIRDLLDRPQIMTPIEFRDLVTSSDAPQP